MTKPYENLARRYRPWNLDGVYGQKTVINIIRGMMKKGRVSQATLLAGPRGLGKTSIARVLAMTYNCLDPNFSSMGGEPPAADADGLRPFGEPCGECKSCESIRQSKSRDVHELNCATTRGIAEAKTLLENAQYMPQSKFRVFILDEFHQMTGDAFQALLKGLEEPPPSTIFILCTSEPSKLPVAIRSRLKLLQLQPLDPDECTRMLRSIAKAEGIKLPKDVFEKIAMAVQGHARDAIQLLEAFDEAIVGSKTEDGSAPEDTDALLARLVEEVIGEPPEALASRFLISLYTRDVSKALQTLRSVLNAPLFCDAVTRLHMQTINWWLRDEKLRDKYFVAFYEKLDKALKEAPDGNFLKDLKQVQTLTDQLVWTGTKVRQHYANDPFPILVDMTLKCVTV